MEENMSNVIFSNHIEELNADISDILNFICKFKLKGEDKKLMEAKIKYKEREKRLLLRFMKKPVIHK
jgi:hypothetical protein